MTASGDFSTFCAQHYPRLVGALGLHCGDRAVGEELAQETLARAWAHWAKVRELEDPSGWTFRVAINLSNSYFRRRSAEKRAMERNSEGRRADVDAATALAVRAAIARLPRRKRTALVARYYLDLPFAEIARLMDSSESTVKSLARRAVEELRKEFEEVDLREADYVC